MQITSVKKCRFMVTKESPEEDGIVLFIDSIKSPDYVIPVKASPTGIIVHSTEEIFWMSSEDSPGLTIVEE